LKFVSLTVVEPPTPFSSPLILAKVVDVIGVFRIPHGEGWAGIEN